MYVGYVVQPRRQSLDNTLLLTRSLREPGEPCTKSMEVWESRMERVNNNPFSCDGHSPFEWIKILMVWKNVPDGNLWSHFFFCVLEVPGRYSVSGCGESGPAGGESCPESWFSRRSNTIPGWCSIVLNKRSSILSLDICLISSYEDMNIHI